MRMDEGLDTGDMIMKEEVVLDEKETGGSLFDRLSEVGADLCVRTLTAIENEQLLIQNRIMRQRQKQP